MISGSEQFVKKWWKTNQTAEHHEQCPKIESKENGKYESKLTEDEGGWHARFKVEWAAGWGEGREGSRMMHEHIKSPLNHHLQTIKWVGGQRWNFHSPALWFTQLLGHEMIWDWSEIIWRHVVLDDFLTLHALSQNFEHTAVQSADWAEDITWNSNVTRARARVRLEGQEEDHCLWLIFFTKSKVE